MNRNECNMARDLMPLCIDSVASEESRQWVEAHMSACEKCARVYTDMQAELAQRIIEENEKKELEAAAKQLRKRRIRKAMMAGALGFLVAATLFLGFHFADEIAFRMQYVCLNGDLRQEALFAKASHNGLDTPVRYIHLSSAPAGSPHFEYRFETEILDDGTSFCLQVRAKYRGWDTEEYDAGGVFCYGYAKDGVWVGYSGEAYGWLPITRIELLCGGNATVLWELGDEVPAQWQVTQEEQRLSEGVSELAR